MEIEDMKKAYYNKIETKEDAIKIIKDSSIGFFVIAIIQIVIGFLVGMITTIIEGVFLLILTLLLKKFNSRIVAVIFLLFSLIAIIVTGINKFGGGQGGRNILLALFMMWLSIRIVKATFLYNRKNTLSKLSNKETQ